MVVPMLTALLSDRDAGEQSQGVTTTVIGAISA
jgi:hypothetical protein